MSPNFQDMSFIEVKAIGGGSSGTDYSFGVTILHIADKKVEVHVVFQLPDMPDGSYYILGDLHPDLADVNIKGTPMLPSPDGLFRLYANTQTWFDVKENTFKAVVITRSKKSEFPFYMVWPIMGSNGRGRGRGKGNVVFIDDHPSFRDYLRLNQIDATILRHHGLVQSCPTLDDYFKQELFINEPRYLDAPLGSAWSTKVSLNRCGDEERLRLLDHSLFKGGSLTPGHRNDCSKKHWKKDVTNYIAMIPTKPYVQHPCGMHGDNHLSVISEEQIKADDIALDMLTTMTQQQPLACESRDVLHDDMADNRIARQVGETKFQRLSYGPLPQENSEQDVEVEEVPIEETEQSPNMRNDSEEEVELLTMEEVEQRARVKEVSEIIKKEQNGKIDGDEVLKHWKWFQYKPNHDHPDQSKFNCRFCEKHLKGTFHSNALSTKEGYLHQDKRHNNHIMRTHQDLLSHKIAVQTDEIQKLDKMSYELGQAMRCKMQPHQEVTNRHHLVVYHFARIYNSFKSHSGTVEMLNALDVNMGAGCNDRHSASRIAYSMASCFKADTIQAIKLSKGPIFLMADGSEDVSSHHYMVLMIQYIGKNLS